MATEGTAMVVVMRHSATDDDVTKVVDAVTEVGGDAFVSRGKHQTIIGLVGDLAQFSELPLHAFPGVEDVIRVSKPYKLVSVETHPRPSTVYVGDVPIGRDTFTLIAGPCAVETEDQTAAACRMAKDAGAVILRGGAYKPRTSPYAFQGLGEKGLDILAGVAATSTCPSSPRSSPRRTSRRSPPRPTCSRSAPATCRTSSCCARSACPTSRCCSSAA